MAIHTWNGYALDNEALGWRVLAESSQGLNIMFENQEARLAGAHGGLPTRGYAKESIYKLSIATDAQYLGRLVGMFTQQSGNTLVIDSMVAENVFVEGINPRREGAGNDDAVHRVDVTVRIPGVWLRAAANADFSASALGSNGILNVFPDLSGSVTDAQLIIEASGITNLKLTDLGSGTVWRYSGTMTGTYRLDFKTGKLYSVSTTSSWTGGTLQSPSTYVNPPNRGFGFEVSPSLVTESGSPRPYGRIRYNGTGGSINLFVRGRAAYTI